MAREKRGLGSSSGDDGQQPDKKRPALASVIVEALKVDSLQKLCSSLEPLLRKVVSEEVERALAKLGSAKLTGRLSPKRIGDADGKNLQLHFRSRLSLPLFTGGKVEGEQGTGIHVVLIDANSGQVVTSGPESSVKLDVIVLEGDFNNEEDDNWTLEEFESHIVKEREGKRPLLNGDLQVTLKEGVGTLGEISFTDNSSWIRSRKFRLGLKVAIGQCDGVRIREAKTDAFTVKDHRGELYKKHYPPALHDEVWRLEKIGKDGSFHKRLNKAGIFTVEDFLRLVVKDSQRLRTILGSGMSNKMWDVLVDHAKTCALNGKLYVYYPVDEKNIGVAFNSIYELSGLIANGQYLSAESLSDNQKVYVDELVKKAYENWMNVLEYDSKMLLDSNHNDNISTSETDYTSSQQNFPNPYHQQVALPTLPAPVNTGSTVGGYDHNMAGRFCNGNLSTQFNSTTTLPVQSQLASTSYQAGFQRSDDLLVPGQQQSSIWNFEDASAPSLGGSDELFHEEEIRMRSQEMLENEDMQNLLRIFNMGSQGGHNPFDPIESYLPPPTQNYSIRDDTSRSSGRGVIGWLKIKAALRWGIFVKRKAAEKKRAQIIELDD